jgi:ribosomal 50S subunit-recycling heat shock protein
MRLDKYLKVSRLIKRRTVANDACDTSRISVNGKVAKASYDVKLGDLITVAFGTKSVTVKVLDIKDTTKKTDAIGMYEVVSETVE